MSRSQWCQDIPRSYNGFAYLIRGPVRIGEDVTVLQTAQVGWLDRPNGEGTSVLGVVAGEDGARLVLYAGQLRRPNRTHGESATRH